MHNPSKSIRGTARVIIALGIIIAFISVLAYGADDELALGILIAVVTVVCSFILSNLIEGYAVIVEAAYKVINTNTNNVADSVDTKKQKTINNLDGIVCSKCNAVNKPAAKYCVNCGTEFHVGK